MEQSQSIKMPTPPSSRPSSLRRPSTRYVTKILSHTANQEPNLILYPERNIRKTDESPHDVNEHEMNLQKYKILPAIGSSSDLRNDVTMIAKNDSKSGKRSSKRHGKLRNNNTYRGVVINGKSSEEVLRGQDIQTDDVSTISKDSSEKTLSASSADDFKPLEIAIRLPDGTRHENCFYDYSTFWDLLQFLMRSGISDEVIPRNCEFVTSEVPQQVFSDLSVTLKDAKLKTRTLLYLRELDPE